MNLHPEMARQLAADRQDGLRLRADRARLGSTARGGLGRSRPVARLVGWWRQDAASAPAHPDHTARAGPVIDLTEGGELMSAWNTIGVHHAAERARADRCLGA